VEDCAVASTIRVRAVRCIQESPDLVALQVLDEPQSRPLEGHGQKALAELKVPRVPGGGVACERMDGGQAGVASSGVVLTVSLEVVEEREEVVGREVPEVQSDEWTPTGAARKRRKSAIASR
jgi:hypothetical protein